MIIRNIVNIRQYCTSKLKNYYVTTPIFYVNASPHIGHLYTAVIADAIARFNGLTNYNKQIVFATGTDEHGTKIQQAAEKNKIPVRNYCDDISNEYKTLFNNFGINYTNYIRTTDEKHVETVNHFWNKLQESDSIYSTNYSGWYCVPDETFLTESQLKTNLDGTKVSLESGHLVEWTSEQNYMFKLSSFQSDILYWINNCDPIRPAKFKKILLDMLADPLPDVSISRPMSRVSWGIQVPNDPTQSIYVWLDALVNYLTVAGYPDPKFSETWPADLQIIGKDILKFHGIYWPAFLIAVRLQPPKELLVHSHWTVDGHKMSKSKSNVINPEERADLYTREGLRYFLLREGVAHSDGNYSDTKLIRILNSELADTLGNLLSRATAKTLNPKQIFPKISLSCFKDILANEATKRLIESLAELPDKSLQHYKSYNFYLVVDTVIATLHAANNFFEVMKPWELKNSIENVEKLETVISITMETLRQCGIILIPIVPELSTRLLDRLNVDPDSRKWNNLNISFKEINTHERVLSNSNSMLFKRIIIENAKDEKLRKKV